MSRPTGDQKTEITAEATTESVRHRRDVIAASAAGALFVVTAVAGILLWLAGRPVHAGAAPLFAQWLPHVGPGTVPALVIAFGVWRHGVELARRLPWRRLGPLAYATAVAWIVSLALVDGWQRGLAGRLATRFEYLHEVPGVTDVPAMLRGFTGRILDFQPDSWTTHVAGHPPGALLVFVGLDRVGLSGGAWAGILCVLVGALTAVAVPHTVRVLGGDEAARATVPFLVLFPGAVWIGASGDGLFAGVTATAIALLATGVKRRSPLLTAAAGLLLGFGCFLSYGLVLMAPIALAVLVLGRARWRETVAAVAGALLVAAGFRLAGFDWFTGYHLLIERYYQGIASDRPYAYWVGANLAVVLVAGAGPAATVILRRAATTRPRELHRSAGPLLSLAAAAAIVAADLSGYSKAEVERIWLPFAVWLPAAAALLPADRRRTWLAVQAVIALLVNHLLLTVW